MCRFVNFLKLNHYLSLLNAFPETTPLNLPRALCASTTGTDPLLPLLLLPFLARAVDAAGRAFARAIVPLFPHVDPRAAPNDRQLAAKKSV